MSHAINVDIIDLGQENGVYIMATSPPSPTAGCGFYENFVYLLFGSSTQLVKDAFSYGKPLQLSMLFVPQEFGDIFTEADFLVSVATDIELPCPSPNSCASIDQVSNIQDAQHQQLTTDQIMIKTLHP